MRATLIIAAFVVIHGTLAVAARGADAANSATTRALQQPDPALQQAAERQRQLLQHAMELEQGNKTAEAVNIYLAIPGCEQRAAQLARTQVDAFLPIIDALLADHQSPASGPRTLLVRGDLLLAHGDKAGALACYRQFVGKIASKPDDGWDQGLVPLAYYPVELPARADGMPSSALPFQPFVLGPGSHRDNWLIRRFIALEAWDDADHEFERIWALYQGLALYQGAAGNKQFLGFGELQFALDYAYFLQRRGQPDRALDLLQGVLIRIDVGDADVSEWQGPWRGISPGEFVRLAYGVFKAAGQETRLTGALQKEIDAGHNQCRSVLARIYRHQEKPDDALAMELAYVDAAKFDAVTRSWHRALIYDHYARLAEAAAEYEQVVAHTPAVPAARASNIGFDLYPSIYVRASDALLRLYAALGKTDKLLDITLQQGEADEHHLADERWLDAAATRFKDAGAADRFTTWLRARAASAKNPETRASAFWMLGDRDATIAALADELKATETVPYRDYGISIWVSKFKDSSDADARTLLTALVKADPQNPALLLELVGLSDDMGDSQFAAALETVLKPDAMEIFSSNGPRETLTDGFRDDFDIAYRLARRYEKLGKIPELEDLALRVARGTKPFVYSTREEYRDANSWRESGNALLGLAVQLADTKSTLPTLAEALAKSPWDGASAQARRRLAGKWPPENKDKPFGWSNLPAGVHLVASCENVLCMCRSADRLWVGQPWGVAVYDSAGQPVTRIALGQNVVDIATVGGAVWAAAGDRLYRIATDNYTLSYVLLDDMPTVLGVQADTLWIGGEHKVRALNTKTMALRIFGGLRPEDDGGWNTSSFVSDDRYVWADGGAGLHRYDLATGLWQTPSMAGVHLVGRDGATLWGDVHVDDALGDRPCIINQQTLEITPISIDNPRGYFFSPRAPFWIVGHNDVGPVFRGDQLLAVYDAKLGKLRPIQDTAALPAGLIRRDPPSTVAEELSRQRGGSVAHEDHWTSRHTMFGKPFYGSEWTTLQWDDKTLFFGGKASNDDDWPLSSYPQEIQEANGGLYTLDLEQHRARRLSAAPFTDTLRGDCVLWVMPDPADQQQVYVGTTVGVAILDRQDRVCGRLSRQDGLVANSVVAGASLGGKLYFGTQWGDSGGGLAVFDPATSVLTSLTVSDGLATDKLAGLLVDGPTLKITYASEYERYGRGGYHIYEPGTYTPASGTFSPPGQPRDVTQDDLFKIQATSSPFLGGHVITQKKLGGKTYVCSTHGLVIFDGPTPQPTVIPELPVKIVQDSATLQLAEARNIKIPNPVPLDQLKDLLKNSNPYLVANALAAAFQPMQAGQRDYIAVVATQINHPLPRVRATAVGLLIKCPDPAAIAPLQTALEDNDKTIRRAAAVALANRDHAPDARFLAEILEDRNGVDNLPFGADSTLGTLGDDAYEAWAPHATPDVFRVLLRVPPSMGDYSNDKTVFPQLGAALRQHPEAADLLLAATDDPRNQNQRASPIAFARDVFGAAGREMLPVLHKALLSDDRVKRSNAARACGAIGDHSSIGPLIAALDFESGLSRASIVWALGQLKATEALPRLAKMYTDMSNDKKSQATPGFMAQNFVSAQSSQYDSIHDLSAIAGDWDELKAAAIPAPHDPVTSEVLLKPEAILQAMRAIGPGGNQDFYRALAGDDQAADETAAGLGEAEKPEDVAKNLPILRGLLANDDARIDAAVSLIILTPDEGRSQILEALKPNSETAWKAVDALGRVKDPAKLKFASAALSFCEEDANPTSVLNHKIWALLEKIPN